MPLQKGRSAESAASKERQPPKVLAGYIAETPRNAAGMKRAGRDDAPAAGGRAGASSFVGLSSAGTAVPGVAHWGYAGPGPPNTEMHLVRSARRDPAVRPGVHPPTPIPPQA